MELENKKVLVVGAGKSGVAVSMFLAQKGARATLTDSKKPEHFNGGLDQLANAGVELVLGENPEVEAGRYDLVVVSPGVPLTVPPVARAFQLNIPVLGELELAYLFTSSPIVAITGTNGKTTTTTLVGEIFKHAGFKTLVGGNIGVPLVQEVEKYGPEDIIVAEVSSFQLETTYTFRPRVGAMLNLTPDHLDRHGDMAGYAAAKAKIFANQRADDYTVLNYDDPETRKLASLSPGNVIFFSRRHTLEKGVFVQGDMIVVKLDGKPTQVMPASDLGIPGAHNLENALAAVACGHVMGISAKQLASALRSFSGVAHRLEFVADINGVSYVNDSKGTNPDASIKALEAYDRPIVLLAGGKNKGSDFTDFAKKAREKARVLVLLGQAAPEIEKAARAAGINEIIRASDFKEAVLSARQAAHPGDVVLLSPACASWDMFNSYEERGDLFKQIVLDLRR